MPVAIRYFKCIFSNGKVKTYRNISSQKFAKLVCENENNLCSNCHKNIVIREKELLNHMGRYDNHNEEINGKIYKIVNTKDRWCRACQIKETSLQNLEIARKCVDYDKAARRLNERTSEEGYLRACRRMYHEMLTRHKNRPNKIMKF